MSHEKMEPMFLPPQKRSKEIEWENKQRLFLQLPALEENQGVLR